ncbi:MAG TPA: LysM peptidoglycan-binding domain-containing protein [Planctomycetota bacterium]|nr:LysM peptidoglycan-binding domain-containing protein [Planctomycetota bacterium]
MQNLLTGVFLLALAALAASVLVFHQFGPPLSDPLPPSMEADPLDDDAPGDVITGYVGHVRNPADPEPEAEPEPPTPPTPPSAIKRLDPRHISVTVKRGQTLGALAREHLNDANAWRAILDANPSLIRPEDLREGQEIVIPVFQAR